MNRRVALLVVLSALATRCPPLRCLGSACGACEPLTGNIAVALRA